MRKWFLVLAALVVVALAAAPASAQTVTGTIQGTVTDTSGGVLPGSTVVIRQTETGAERMVVTNDSGFYSAPYIPLGPYSVAASLAGFGSVTRDGIRVGLNDTRVVDFKLDPKVTELVTVTGDAPPINSVSGEVKGTLTTEQIMDMPISSPGSFLGLAAVFPGFQENPTSGQNNPTASSGSSINFNNTGTRGATFQINGVNNDDSSENQNRQGAALATIQEFQVLKNGYSAEFGRGDGAVVLVQTKAGTNKLTGEAYLYQQDSTWNARSFFAVPGSAKPNRQRSQYGVTAGFPIIRRKLFAFANADRTKSDGENSYTRDLFSPAELAAPRLTRGNDTPENRAWIQSILDRFPASMVPNDSRSTRTFTGVQNVNFPDQDYSGRLDWNFRKDNALVSRYQWTHQLREPQDVIRGEQANQDNTQQNLGVTWTRVFNGRMVGEARYGIGVRSTNVDVADGNDTPIVRFTGTPVLGSSIGSAGNFPIHRDQTDQQFVYNLTWQWFRNHSLKTGTDIRRQKLDDLADNFSRGFWTFTTSCGGVAYATPYLAMLDGCVNRFEKSYGPFFIENRMNEANVYAQDDWRVMDNLTVNLGLRYEYVAAPKEVEGRVDYIFGADKDNIEPRVGFAFVPKWDSGFLGRVTGGTGHFSVRGGYGVYDGRIFQSIFSQGGANVRFNPPNALNRILTNVLPNALNVADPSLGFVFTPGIQVGRSPSLTLPDRDLEMPSTTKWNISVDRVMPWNSSLKISYQGNHNDKRLKYAIDNLPLSPVYGPVLVVDHPNNAPAAGFPDLRGKTIAALAADVRCAGTGTLPNINVTAACPNVVPIADHEISQRVPRTAERRPNPNFTQNLLISNDAESWYDGLEIEWVKRLSQGLQFQAAYTFSQSLDTTSEATFVGAGDSNQQGPNKKYSKGKARFDTPHRFTFNGSYRLPFLAARRDLIGQAFGGWAVSGIARFVSGTPFGITASGNDLDFDGFAESRPVILNRAVIGARVNDRDTSTQLLKASDFRNPTFGDGLDDLVPRNSFYSDGVKSVDLTLAKVIKMPFNNDLLSVRIEAYNVFNRVQFGIPVTDINNGAFGQINGVSNAYNARVVQLLLRYRY